MKGSYKIALALAAALCVFVVWYYAAQPPAEPRGTVVVAPTDGSAPVPTAPDQVTSGSALSVGRPNAVPAGPGRPTQVAPAGSTGTEPALRLPTISNRARAVTTANTDRATARDAAKPDRADRVRRPRPAARDQGTGPGADPKAAVTAPLAFMGPADRSAAVEPDAGSVPAITLDGSGPAGPGQLNPAVSSEAATQPSRLLRRTQYTIKADDTFESIAVALYDDGRQWQAISKANPLVDPIRLQIGQVIRVPSAPVVPDPAELAPTAPRKGRAYTVRPGDSLSEVARQFYGDASQWRLIFNANRRRIGNNPNRIQAGQSILIPPSPQGEP